MAKLSMQARKTKRRSTFTQYDCVSDSLNCMCNWIFFHYINSMHGNLLHFHDGRFLGYIETYFGWPVVTSMHWCSLSRQKPNNPAKKPADSGASVPDTKDSERSLVPNTSKGSKKKSEPDVQGKTEKSDKTATKKKSIPKVDPSKTPTGTGKGKKLPVQDSDKNSQKDGAASDPTVPLSGKAKKRLENAKRLARFKEVPTSFCAAIARNTWLLYKIFIYTLCSSINFLYYRNDRRRRRRSRLNNSLSKLRKIWPIIKPHQVLGM